MLLLDLNRWYISNTVLTDGFKLEFYKKILVIYDYTFKIMYDINKVITKYISYN